MVKSRNSTTGSTRRKAATQKQKTASERIAEIAKKAMEEGGDDVRDREANDKILDVLREAGFSGMSSRYLLTVTFQTRVLSAAAQELLKLEDKYGAMEDYRGKKFNAANAIMWNGAFDPATGEILLSTLVADAEKRYNRLRFEQTLGNKVRTGELTLSKSMRYTPTHEYGHVLEYAMFKKDVATGAWSVLRDGSQNDWRAAKRNEVIKIAREKYGYTGREIWLTPTGRYSKTSPAQSAVYALSQALSSYATSHANGDEFFSEAFVDYRLGDGPIGKAYGDWLRGRGL